MLALEAVRVSRAGLPCLAPVPSPRDQARAVQAKTTTQERALELRHEPGGKADISGCSVSSTPSGGIWPWCA